jgi:hypothetical protein
MYGWKVLALAVKPNAPGLLGFAHDMGWTGAHVTPSVAEGSVNLSKAGECLPRAAWAWPGFWVRAVQRPTECWEHQSLWLDVGLDSRHCGTFSVGTGASEDYGLAQCILCPILGGCSVSRGARF